MRDLVVSPAMGVSMLEPGVVGVDARIAPPFMEATDASRLVCVVVVSYQEYSLTHTHWARDWRALALTQVQEEFQSPCGGRRAIHAKRFLFSAFPPQGARYTGTPCDGPDGKDADVQGSSSSDVGPPRWVYTQRLLPARFALPLLNCAYPRSHTRWWQLAAAPAQATIDSLSYNMYVHVSHEQILDTNPL